MFKVLKAIHFSGVVAAILDFSIPIYCRPHLSWAFSRFGFSTPQQSLRAIN